MKAEAERLNSLPIDTDGHTPESNFYNVNIKNILVKTFHTMFCSCYVLDSRLHNAGSIGLPKWELRSNICVYLGHATFHARSVALVYPLDMSAHSTMLSLTMTSQRYHEWKQEQSHHIGQI
jgi:hypothetical protein